MGLVRKFRPGVFLLNGVIGGRPLVLSLFVGKEQCLLLDTGCAPDVETLILPGLAEIGIAPSRLTLVITTHCDVDHQGGNAGMKRAAPQAKLGCGLYDKRQVESPDVIMSTRYDAYRQDHGIFYDSATTQGFRQLLGMPQSVDFTLGGGEKIRMEEGWELEALHLPGHSEGHVGLWDHRHNILFGGDALHGNGCLDLAGKPAFCPTYLSIQPYLGTVRRVESLPLDGYVGCHWPIQEDRAGVKAFCQTSRAFVERAEQLIIAATEESESGATLLEICLKIGPELGDWPREVHRELCYAVAGHLTDLIARGRVSKSSIKSPVRYTAQGPRN
jgi:glyoxylase-like metal-dependent hydrolase (beta-lactamase superfamily II)